MAILTRKQYNELVDKSNLSDGRKLWIKTKQVYSGIAINGAELFSGLRTAIDETFKPPSSLNWYFLKYFTNTNPNKVFDVTDQYWWYVGYDGVGFGMTWRDFYENFIGDFLDDPNRYLTEPRPGDPIKDDLVTAHLSEFNSKTCTKPFFVSGELTYQFQNLNIGTPFDPQTVNEFKYFGKQIYGLVAGTFARAVSTIKIRYSGMAGVVPKEEVDLSGCDYYFDLNITFDVIDYFSDPTGCMDFEDLRDESAFPGQETIILDGQEFNLDELRRGIDITDNGIPYGMFVKDLKTFKRFEGTSPEITSCVCPECYALLDTKFHFTGLDEWILTPYKNSGTACPKGRWIIYEARQNFWTGIWYPAFVIRSGEISDSGELIGLPSKIGYDSIASRRNWLFIIPYAGFTPEEIQEWNERHG